jgi:hypothetical protein
MEGSRKAYGVYAGRARRASRFSHILLSACPLNDWVFLYE